MAYFFLSGKLLQEDSFLNFVSRIYKDFLSRNEAEYETYVAAGNSLTLDRKAWISRCKDEKTLREEEGTLQSFRSFALSRLRTLISMDMDIFVKDFRAGKINDNQAFLKEAADLKAHITTAPYLAPVTAELTVALSNIPADIFAADTLTASPVSGSGQVLRWNGSLESLCTLFRDLQMQKPGKSGQAYLEHSTEEIAEFLAQHFRDLGDNPFSKAVLLNYLQEKPGEKAKKGKIQLPPR